VSGREILPGNIFRSLLLTIAGILLINSDQQVRDRQGSDHRARKPLPS
jgi:hypothetical protein